MKREEIIATANKISELRSKIAELELLRKELKRLEASLDEVTGENVMQESSGTSVEERAGQLIESHNDRDWSAKEVSEQLGTKVPTTRAAFSKLRKAGRIEDTKRGRVRAKSKIQKLPEGSLFRAA